MAGWNLPTFKQVNPQQYAAEEMRRRAQAQAKAAWQTPVAGVAGSTSPMPQQPAWQQQGPSPGAFTNTGPLGGGTTMTQVPLAERIADTRREYGPQPYVPSPEKAAFDAQNAQYSADVQETVAPWQRAAGHPSGSMLPPVTVPGANEARPQAWNERNQELPPAGAQWSGPQAIGAGAIGRDSMGNVRAIPAWRPEVAYSGIGPERADAQANLDRRLEARGRSRNVGADGTGGGPLRGVGPAITDQAKYDKHVAWLREQRDSGVTPIAERRAMVRANAQGQPMTPAQARYQVNPTEENLIAAYPQLAPARWQAQAMEGKMRDTQIMRQMQDLTDEMAKTTDPVRLKQLQERKDSLQGQMPGYVDNVQKPSTYNDQRGVLLPPDQKALDNAMRTESPENERIVRQLGRDYFGDEEAFIPRYRQQFTPLPAPSATLPKSSPGYKNPKGSKARKEEEAAWMKQQGTLPFSFFGGA